MMMKIGFFQEWWSIQKAVITFYGTSVEELEREFRTSVDDYIEWCKEDGVEPEKPYSGKFNVRFSPELHEKAAVGAKILGISLNSFIERSVRDELKGLSISIH